MKIFFRFPILVLCFFGSMHPLVAQWIRTNDLTGGFGFTQIYCFAASDTNLFAGGYGGIFLSANNGISWTAVKSGSTHNTNDLVSALAVNGTNIFAGTFGDGVFLSTNNGSSWTAVDSGLTSYNVTSLAINDTNLFAGTFDGGVFLSTNNGTSWNAVNTGLPFTSVAALAISDTDLFVGAVHGAGVFHSTSYGKSWFATDSSLKGYEISTLFCSDDYLIAGTHNNGVYISTNSGVSWLIKGAILPDGNSNIFGLVVSGLNIFVGSYGGIFLTTNNTTSWSTINTGLTNTDVTALVLFDSNLYVGISNGSVWKRPLSEVITSVETTPQNLSINFSLNQNYPNPFNSTTNITFSVQSNCLVSLKIFDPLGREIATLANEYLLEGIYTRRWDTKNASSGIYFYRLQSNGSSVTRKMLLLK